MTYKIVENEWIENDVPFLKLLGIDVKVPTMGESETVITQDNTKHNSDAPIVHCGVPMSLLVTAMGMAGKTKDPYLRDTITLGMNTSFVQPATGKLTARATTLQVTATLAFCEGRVYNEKGELCTSATGTFKYIRRPSV
jgi:uncharacterized protein (TIGR00369 family)